MSVVWFVSVRIPERPGRPRERHGTPGSPATTRVVRPAVADLAGVRVLALDDNATNRTIVREQLSAGGLSVSIAADGPGALKALSAAALEERPFAVAVLDMHMPDMDGLMLARAIRADRTHAEGMDGYVSKPVRLQELATVIGSLGECQRGRVAEHAVPRPRGSRHYAAGLMLWLR